MFVFFFQAEDGIRDYKVTGVQTCALPISIAHLGEAERMFVVTRLLTEIVSWMRTQPGSPSLRALLYMDEVFGYFPPTENPPCKRPMLTLLKQARAYGVGCVLSTQNPVDLDYKGLSNCGTWFLGRLQTERDKARVIDGLESAATGPPGQMDRATLDRTLAGLAPGTFVLNNIHEDEPVLMKSRWALSYLAGPLSRTQIKQLGDAQETPKPAPLATMSAAPPSAAPAASGKSEETGAAADARVVLPPVANESVLPIMESVSAGESIVYRPILLTRLSVHYAHARAGVDERTKPLPSSPPAARGSAACTGLAVAPRGPRPRGARRRSRCHPPRRCPSRSSRASASRSAASAARRPSSAPRRRAAW